MRDPRSAFFALFSFAAACGGSSSSPVTQPTEQDGGARASGSSSAGDAGSARQVSSSSAPQPSMSRGESASSSGEAAQAPDGGTTDAGGASPTAALEAAPADTWTWVPVTGSHCGNGSATGIGWNRHAGATQLLIFLQGGGACTDGASCWGATPTASNMTGYGASDFAADPTIEAEIFQRAGKGNPFAAANMVFVPYCTGDLHVGAGLVTYTVNGVATPTYFNGAKNVDTFVAALRAASPNQGLTRVFLSGVSAGGFGSFLNQDAVARAFAVRTDVIDDSGPAISGTGIPSDWSVRLPPTCTTCTDLHSIFAFTRATYPESRYGLLTFKTDTTLPLFFGQTDQAFAALIADFVSSLASDPNAKAFVDTSSGHVVLEETDAVAAPFILPWLTQLASDDPAWATVSH